MTMLTDGVKAKEKAETVAVKDIAELVLESVDPSAYTKPEEGHLKEEEQ